MKILELRRHSMREQGGQHLNQAGVTLARRVGESLGKFDRVITSALPRAFETALAMGYAVDEQSDAIGIMPGDANAEINWPQSFANIARVIARGGAGARFAREQARVWRALVAALPENGRALVISHGGMIEAGAIACAPDADHRAWGDALGYCEGARLSFENDECMNVQVLRVEGTAISNQ